MEEDRNIPEHIGFIMDGNRRWARKRGLPILQGHTKGANTFEKIANYCSDIGVKYITAFAFSTENWNRSKEEVDYLMNLLEQFIKDFDKRFKNSNAKIRLAGDITGLPEHLQGSIRKIEERTQNNDGIVVNLCINYGGRAEMVNSTKIIAEKVKSGEITVDDINEDLIASNLRTGDAPDPDLIIRTAGELRLSGFLLWQSAYSELYFCDEFWPDFNEKELDKAIDEYNSRKRNFGK